MPGSAYVCAAQHCKEHGMRSGNPSASRHGVRWLGMMVAPALLVACGGGGDEPAAPAAREPVFEVAAALAALGTGASEVFTLSGTMAGQPATLRMDHAALPDAPYETFGNMNTMRRTATLTAGSTTSTRHETHYLDLAAHTYYGMADGDGMHRTSTSRAPYPDTARVGDRGLLYDASHHDAADHHRGGMMMDAARSHVTWSLEPGTGPDDANLCINAEMQTTHGTPTGEAQQHCYRIDPAGTPLGMRVRMTSPEFGTAEFR
jgi:hypothetical protein